MSTTILNNLRRFRTGIERRLTQQSSNAFWKKQHTVGLEEAHEIVRTGIDSKSPFCVARLGGVEQTIVLWGRHIPQIGRFGLRLPIWFSDTKDGAPNAGIHPRNKSSYKAFADLAFESLKRVDLMAKWNSSREYAVLRKIAPLPCFCDVEHLSSTMPNENHWVESLHGKRVLVVSPFKSSIETQMMRMDQIWEKRSWKWQAKFLVKKFPYLIDQDCSQSWQDVWNEMRLAVRTDDYDVALFGCGGLGLPLAAAAKDTGRIGIHLGGHLQLLFGIYGQRHLEQEWHARWINEAWIRPAPGEVAKTAKNVEDGCY